MQTFDNQDELAEAKVIQKYNAQLHKDLQREQLARKKLHNDMEDLKGKIRVYVRIRPFSNSERERGSTEAVTKVEYAYILQVVVTVC